MTFAYDQRELGYVDSQSSDDGVERARREGARSSASSHICTAVGGEHRAQSLNTSERAAP
jgi:hypothetical protein